MEKRRLALYVPQASLKGEFLKMAAEYRSSGERYSEYETIRQDFPAFLGKLDDQAKGRNLSPGIVPMDTFWLIKDGKVVLGESRLRHRLTLALEVEGGHIGYTIRPSARRQGYGRLILSLTLKKADARGLRRVMVTCDDDNIGSRRIIEANGGVLSGKAISPYSGKVVLHYWIDLQKSGEAQDHNDMRMHSV